MWCMEVCIDEVEVTDQSGASGGLVQLMEVDLETSCCQLAIEMARFKFSLKRLRMDLDEVVDSDEGWATEGAAAPRQDFNFETDDDEEPKTCTLRDKQLATDEQRTSFEDTDRTTLQSLGKRQRDESCEMQNARKKPRLGQTRTGKRPSLESQPQTHFPGFAVTNRGVSRTCSPMSSSEKGSAEAWGCSLFEKPKILVMRGDPTDWSTGAIVNDANSLLQHNCGLAATIVRKGGRVIQQASTEWIYCSGEVPIGSAIPTTAGRLSSKYIIHTVGPDVTNSRWPTPRHQLELRQAVRTALNMAKRLGVKSIAIPAISTGVSNYPKHLAAREIVAECLQFCDDALPTVLQLIVLMNEDEVTTSIFSQTLKDARRQRQLQRHY